MARYAVDGRKIREIRLGKGITSKELASKADISVATLLMIEEGRRNPTEGTLFSIAKALGVGAEELLSHENNQVQGGSSKAAHA